MYAIVDIETTGSYAAANGITEISIQVFDGEKVVDKFETLINPGQSIPRYIQAMTGITDAMVSTAPRFAEVAEKIYRHLHDKIFVAHNVNFDYSFIKSHLNSCGYELNTKKLCTVRLSRKIIPGHNSYSLGKLCDALGIYIDGRHRAYGDAAATAQLFQLLIQQDKEKHIEKSLKKTSKEQTLPPNVPKEHFDKLPYTPGVYYFHNEKGKIVYVGKAKNIRYRVNSHFSNNSDGRQKQNFLRHVHAISFKECGTELMAALLESTEIKKLWPAFNASQKRWEDVYGIFMYEDQNGYMRLAIEKNRKHLQPVYSFHYLVDGHAILRKLVKEFGLCPKFCFLRKDNEDCDAICNGACRREETTNDYNNRVLDAIGSLQHNPSFVIVDKGLTIAEQSCILVLNGKFYGMGYVPADAQVSDTNSLKDYITPYRENSFTRNTVLAYAARYPHKIQWLSDASINPATESSPPMAFD